MILLINCVISALLVTLLMWLDRYEKENIVTLMKIFCFTIFATSIYAIAVSWLITSFSFTNIVIIGPILEETWKFLIFLLVLYKFKNEVNESFDAIVYMGVIALGFAFYENISYYVIATWQSMMISTLTMDLSYYNASLYSIFLARLLPGHLLFDMIAISIYGIALQKGKKSLRFFFAWLIAIFLHAFWNFSVQLNFVFTVYSFLLITAAIFAVFKLLNISKFKPESEFGDESIIPDKSIYDWSYYLLVFIFVIICGSLSLLITYAFESILLSSALFQ
ncbi:MAG: PrsW family glutamic-type intramembrane protease [Candidatus Stygibacter australis]|nr:PrsW family glutamic-type intramembrane protease [Candidatus Stygibacter australis]